MMGSRSGCSGLAEGTAGRIGRIVLMVGLCCLLVGIAGAQTPVQTTKSPGTRASSVAANTTAPDYFDAGDMQLMVRLIDVSRLVAALGPALEPAIRAKGLERDAWVLGMLGNTGGADAMTPGSKLPGFPPAIPGLSGPLDPLGRDKPALTQWVDDKWRPELKRQSVLLGLSEGPSPTAAPTSETIRTAMETILRLTFGDPANGASGSTTSGGGSRDEFKPPTRLTGDPRLSKGGVQAAAGAVAAFVERIVGGGKGWDSSGGGGGVRGTSVPEGGSGGSNAPPDPNSVWGQMILLGSNWERINPKMGQPSPVNPGVDPVDSRRTRERLAKTTKPALGNPGYTDPNPEASGKGGQGRATVKPTSVKGGKVPSPDPSEPEVVTHAPTPLPGKGGTPTPKPR
jgi:hypothetical protein